ncbi:phage holin family protein [Actinosynnema sp. NPDC020468]|uniref:phage holin family protein n=1 Tax=Actinosynnema sp. NPDC020468 TaxID=3154488 RepID=UPI0033C776C5
MNRVAAEHEPSTAELVGRLSEQVSRLARDEIRLALAEVKDKGKHVGVGAGLLGGAGVLAWFGVGALVAGAVLALALVLPAWAAALVVAGVVFLVAGVLALVGKKQVGQGTPPLPEQAVESVKRDISAVSERAHR